MTVVVLPAHRARPRAGTPASGTPYLVLSALALALALTLPGPAQAQAAASTELRTFQIPAGSLATGLAAFARASGVTFSYDAALLAERSTRGLNGAYTVADGLNTLLAGTGLQAVVLANGAYSLRVGTEAAVAQLAPVRVRADAIDALQAEASAAQGYRPTSISSVGALGGMAVRDAPYAISVMSEALILNTQAQSPDDLYRINPATLSQTPQGSGWAPMVKTRGFNSYDRAEDGLRRAYGFATSLEDKERVEVFSGLSGFLYGAASPGGMVNYVNKRPTAERLNRITLGNYGGSQYYVHGDFGGPIDADGRLGYRINLVRQDGDSTIDQQHIDRTLVSTAFDWRVTDRLKLELNAAYSDYRMRAPIAYWFVREGVPRIDAPDASRNWGQPWVADRTKSRKVQLRATYEINDAVTLRTAYLDDRQDRPQQDHTMNSVRATDAYYQTSIHSGETRTRSQAWQALADVRFATGPVTHTLTAGLYGMRDRQWSTSYSPNTGYLGPFSLSAPTHLPQPLWPADTTDGPYFASQVRNDNLMLADQIRFNPQWSAIVGINRSTIKTIGRTATGAPSAPDYDHARNSPSVSVIYEPTDWLMTYATYIEGLEAGGVAPTTALNALAVMPPIVSRQKEIGLKAELGGVLLTGALFDIEQAYEYVDGANVYTQDGRQRHRGGEVMAQGKVTHDWTVWGGVTLLQAKVRGGANDGNTPMNVPKFVAKLYTEYALPVPGLSLSGGVYHVGSQWASATNTSRLPAYTTVDLGARYATTVAGMPTVVRLNVNNVFDRSYWLNSYYLGNPRGIAFSAQLSF